MQIVDHCSFKKLTVSLLSSIFPFHVYLQPLALRVPKKTIKPKKTTRVGLYFKNGFF